MGVSVPENKFPLQSAFFKLKNVDFQFWKAKLIFVFSLQSFVVDLNANVSVDALYMICPSFPIYREFD